MRILDVRRQHTDKIYRLQMQYPARFYRAIGTEHSHRETTDADIKEFRQRAEKEGAVALFISNYGQTAYIPVEWLGPMPQAIVGDDMLQYYKVPPEAY